MVNETQHSNIVETEIEAETKPPRSRAWSRDSQHFLLSELDWNIVITPDDPAEPVLHKILLKKAYRQLQFTITIMNEYASSSRRSMA